MSPDELELRRIEAGVPRWGHELDDRVLPAEAGLDATHVSFSKGCYPGQEPIARLHYRGHVNRSLLQVVELDDGTAVERVTSQARRPDGTVVALAYVRTTVPRLEPRRLVVGAGGARTSSPRRTAARCAATGCTRCRRTSSSRPRGTRAGGATRTPNASRPPRKQGRMPSYDEWRKTQPRRSIRLHWPFPRRP